MIFLRLQSRRDSVNQKPRQQAGEAMRAGREADSGECCSRRGADNVDHGAVRKYSRIPDKYTGPDVLG